MYRDIDAVASNCGVSVLVIGAAARDLVLHYVHGAAIRRATRDIDFGVQVPDLNTFQNVRNELMKRGYAETTKPHRLVAPNAIPIDIVPFGRIADSRSSVALQPDQTRRMSVLGFDEAFRHSETILIDRTSGTGLQVASPPGMCLMKLIAWTDRIQGRARDAADLLHLCENYERIPAVTERLYGKSVAILKRHGWDIQLGSAHLLGVDTGAMASPDASVKLDELLDDQIKGASMTSLLQDMTPDRSDESMVRTELLMLALFAGLRRS